MARCDLGPIDLDRGEYRGALCRPRRSSRRNPGRTAAARRGPLATAGAPARRTLDVSLDLDDLAAHRLAAQLRRAPPAQISRPSAIRATASHSSASPTYWVVTSSVRPSRTAGGGAPLPDRLLGGADPGRPSARRGPRLPARARERARELEPPLHAARQLGRADGLRTSPTGRRSSEHRLRTRVRRTAEISSRPNRLATEFAFSPTVRSGNRLKSWGVWPIRSRVRRGSRPAS